MPFILAFEPCWRGVWLPLLGVINRWFPPAAEDWEPSLRPLAFILYPLAFSLVSRSRFWHPALIGGCFLSARKGGASSRAAGRRICLARSWRSIVAQVSKPAVPQASKPAPLPCAQRVWKPARQQTWKSAPRQTDTGQPDQTFLEASFQFD